MSSTWPHFGVISVSLLRSSYVWCYNYNTHPAARYLTGMAVGIPCAALCIQRRLYLISTIRSVTTTKQEKRRAVLVDLAIGLGIPLLQMVLRSSSSLFIRHAIADITYRSNCARPSLQYLRGNWLHVHNICHTFGIRPGLHMAHTHRMRLRCLLWYVTILPTFFFVACANWSYRFDHSCFGEETFRVQHYALRQ